MFKMTINDKQVNQNAKLLGDRTLSAYLSKEGNGISFATYSYSNMKGEGNANAVQSVPHK